MAPFDPDRPTDDELPAAEDRWYEDDADPSPALLRGLTPYPTEPAYKGESAGEDPPRSPLPAILLAAGAVCGLALLCHWLKEAR